ncbi:MAG: hypothetical protein QMD25_01670 [Caldisericia bacterium]|jgi:hypothetical protein|nr:hypothetical protein [Caldisericia bacterium]
MSYFTIIIILYIVLYFILTIVSAINERKRKEEISIKEKVKKEEVLEEQFKIEKAPEKIYQKEKLEEEFVQEVKEEILKEEVEQKPPLYKEKEFLPIKHEELPSKLKKVLSFSKSDILKGIIFKEILTPKFKK